MQQQTRLLQKLVLKIPASAGNLGPGLDCLGLALGLYARLTFSLYERPQFDKPVVSLHGAIADLSTEADQSQLIYSLLRRLWSEGGDLLQRVHVQVDSDIPLGAGLGSTAATILGSLWASKVLKDLIPTRNTLIAEGVELEGYPETLASSLLGGFVVCAPAHDKRQYVTQRHNWPDKWQILLAVPQFRLKTAQARAVLSKKVDLEAAIANVQRTALMVAAVANADESALKEALHDELHERARASLVPELAELKALLKHEPVIGCVLSGAGPGVLVIVNAAHKQLAKERLVAWANEKQGRKPIILDVPVDPEGMQIVEHEINR